MKLYRKIAIIEREQFHYLHRYSLQNWMFSYELIRRSDVSRWMYIAWAEWEIVAKRYSRQVVGRYSGMSASTDLMLSNKITTSSLQ